MGSLTIVLSIDLSIVWEIVGADFKAAAFRPLWGCIRRAALYAGFSSSIEIIAAYDNKDFIMANSINRHVRTVQATALSYTQNDVSTSLIISLVIDIQVWMNQCEQGSRARINLINSLRIICRHAQTKLDYLPVTPVVSRKTQTGGPLPLEERWHYELQDSFVTKKKTFKAFDTLCNEASVFYALSPCSGRTAPIVACPDCILVMLDVIQAQDDINNVALNKAL